MQRRNTKNWVYGKDQINHEIPLPLELEHKSDSHDA